MTSASVLIRGFLYVCMIGAGLKQLPDERIVCTNAGILRYRPANRYWVDYNYKRVREGHTNTH